MLRCALCLSLALLVVSCREVREEEVPVSRKEAVASIGYELPIPAGAAEVQYFLIGKTQSWNLYVAYTASYADTEEVIAKELSSFAEEMRGFGKLDQVSRQPISEANLTARISREAPRWWNPKEIKNGYYSGAMCGSYRKGYWIDKETGRVFYFSFSS